jgi:hypothetical protein
MRQTRRVTSPPFAGFGVPEVWLFRNGAFEIYRLAGDHSDRVERSGFLPELDFALIAEGMSDRRAVVLAVPW